MIAFSLNWLTEQFKKKDIRYLLLMFAFILAIFWRIVFLQRGLIFEDNSSLLAFRAVFSSALKNGTIPFWSPYCATGFAQYVSPFSPSFHPLDLFAFKYLKLLAAFNYLFLSDLLMIVFFSYLFLRAIDVSCEGSFIGSLSFVLGSYVLGLTGSLPQIHIIPWLPATFLFIELYFRKKKISYLLLCSCSILLAIFSGWPQTLLYILYASSFYFLWKTVQTSESKKEMIISLAGWFLAIFLAFLISSIWTLPALEYLKFSTRSSGLAFAKAIKTGAYNPVLAFTFIYPNLLLGKHGKIGQYFSTYIGILPLFFSIFAFLPLKGKNRSQLLFFGTMFLVSLFISVGRHKPFFPFFSYLPGLSFFHSPIRVLLLMHFSFLVFTGIGFDRFLLNHRRIRRPIIIPLMAIGLVFPPMLLLVMKSTGFFMKFPHPLRERIADITPLSVITPSIMLLAAATLFFLLFKKKISPRTFTSIVLVLISLDLVTFAWQGNGLLFRDIVDRRPAVLAYLKNDKSIYRIFSIPPRLDLSLPKLDFNEQQVSEESELLIPPMNEKYGISTPNVDTGMADARLFKMNYLIEGEPLEGHIYNPVAVKNVQKYTKFLGFLNVKYILTREPIHNSSYKLVWHGSVYLYQNIHFLPRAFVINYFRNKETILPAKLKIKRGQGGLMLSQFVNGNVQGPGRKADVVYNGLNEVSVKVTSGAKGYLLLTDANYPGWEASVDGRRASIITSDHVFRAVAIDKGNHRVNFSFRPPLFRLGKTLSLIGLAVAFLIVLLQHISPLWRKPLGL